MPEFRAPKRLRITPPMVETRKFWREYFIYSTEFLPLAAGTANAAPSALAFTGTNNIGMDSDSDFEWISTMYVATDSRVYTRIIDNKMGRRIHALTLDMRNIAGQALSGITANGFVAYERKTPYLISASSSFQMEAADFSGSSNTVRISFHGCKVRPGVPPYSKAYKAKLPHIYVIEPTSIAANQTQTFVIRNDNDGDYLVSAITGSRTGACLVTIKNGTDKAWMNIPVHFDNLIGNGQFPNELKYPKFVRNGESLTVTIQDISGSANVISIFLECWKLLG